MNWRDALLLLVKIVRLVVLFDMYHYSQPSFIEMASKSHPVHTKQQPREHMRGLTTISLKMFW